MIQKRTMIFVSLHAFISKWCWIGAIRKMRLPQYLNDSTCKITESATSAKMPPTKSSNSSTLSMIAIAAIPPPIAIAPVSPKNTSAGKALNQRKPTQAPISAAPMKAASRRFSIRPWVAVAERMKIVTAMAVKVARAMIPVPAASPSTPSVRFTPLTAPAMIRNTSTYQNGPSGNDLSMTGTKRW